MYRIDLPHMLYVMDRLAEGEVINRIEVSKGIAKWGKVAMERMLDVTMPVPGSCIPASGS